MANDELIKAIQGDDLDKVRILLGQGADVDEKDDNGNSALVWAAYKDHKEIVQVLLAYGANIHFSTRGMTALAVARRDGHAAIVELLEEAEKKATLPSENWTVMNDHQIAHIETLPAIGEKLSTIFNFRTGRSFIIADSLQIRAKAITPPEKFSDMPPEMLEEALEQFTKHGGKADEDFILRLRGFTRLNKTNVRP